MEATTAADFNSLRLTAAPVLSEIGRQQPESGNPSCRAGLQLGLSFKSEHTADVLHQAVTLQQGAADKLVSGHLLLTSFCSSSPRHSPPGWGWT